MTEKELKARLNTEAERWADTTARLRLEYLEKQKRIARRTQSLEALLWISAILMVASIVTLFIIAGGF